MAKKINLDNRVTVNGKKSNLELDNFTNLNDWTTQIINEAVPPLIAAIPAGTLAATLLAGNTTGATDIIVTNDQAITSSNATASKVMEITFVGTGLGDDLIRIRRSSTGVNTGEVEVATSGAYLNFWSNAGVNKTSFFVAGENEFYFEGLGAPTLVLDDASGFTGTLTETTLTGSQVWTFPNKTGAVALVEDVDVPVIFKTFADTPYAAAWGEDIEVDCTAGNVVINLPASVGNNGKKISITRLDGTVNTLTVNSFAGETLNGVAAYVALTTQYDTLTAKANGKVSYYWR